MKEPLSAAAMHRRPKKRKSTPEKSPSQHARPVKIDELENTFGNGRTHPSNPDQGEWGNFS